MRNQELFPCMKRRSLLGALAITSTVGAAGCLETIGFTGDDESITERTITAVEIGTDHDDVSLSANIEQHVTEDSPGILTVEWTNHEAERTFWFTGFEIPEFSFLGHEETDAELLARSTEHDHVATPEEPTDGCWVYDFAAPRPASVAPKTMGPGESVTAEFSLAAPPVNDEGVPDPCLPPGTYTDGETVEYFLGGDIDSEDEPDGTVTTSLEMTLEEI